MMAQMEVSESAPQILLRYLEELVEIDFKTFKLYLKDYQVKEGYKVIPKSRLEKTDHVDTADALLSYYQEEYAFEITGDLLHKINRNDLLEEFKVDTKTCKYKTFFVKETSRMKH